MILRNKNFEYIGKIFGEALANFVSFTLPVIILTGSLAHSGKWILEPTKNHLNKTYYHFTEEK